MPYSAQNPALNATLAQGHDVVSKLRDDGISVNPRLYVDNFAAGGSLIPEMAAQDNSDLPGWAEVNADGTTVESLLSSGAISQDSDLYLFVFVAESNGGAGNFCGVADIIRYTASGVMTLKQAVGVA